MEDFAKFRRTGRTHRMLEAASHLAWEGKYVLIVMSDMRMIRYAEAMLSEILDEHDIPHRIVGSHKTRVNEDVRLGEISFLDMHDPQVDLQLGKLRGVHPSVNVLWDHFALELHMGWMYKEWLRYVEPELPAFLRSM